MSNLTAIEVPDIGDFDTVEVIEILVKVGDSVKAEQSMITVESDKASMEIPSSQSGVVKSIAVKVGDQVKRGSVMLQLEASASQTAAPVATAPAVTSTAVLAPATMASTTTDGGAGFAGSVSVVGTASSGTASTAVGSSASQVDKNVVIAPAAGKLELPASTVGLPHASPSVRKFARELGVDLVLVKGSGPKQRIVLDDIQNFVKQALAGGTAASASTTNGSAGVGFDLLPWPKMEN